MEAFITSGRIVDLVLVYILLEAGFIFVCWRRGRGISPSGYLTLLLPGLFIFLALREAFMAGRWQIIALFLLASFAAHIVDVRSRWRVRPKAPPP